MSISRTHLFTPTPPCECCGTIPCQQIKPESFPAIHGVAAFIRSLPDEPDDGVDLPPIGDGFDEV